MPLVKTIPLELIEEGQRVMSICNACRYCEGFCAVFPALERRLSFAESDLNYLANLCHNCGSCYHACQYAPPHEFALNFPKTLAEIRGASYRKYAWPGVFSCLFRRNGMTVTLLTATGLLLWLLKVILFTPSPAVHPAAGFYAVIPHNDMAIIFGAIALFALLAFAVGVMRFWHDMGEGLSTLLDLSAWKQATRDALQLKYLDGGGDGCTYPQERPSHARRRFHHLTFYGFMLCFAATSVGTIYHYLFGWMAPYPIASLPVLLGSLGGIGLLVGPVGLLWLKYRSDPELSDRKQLGMDAGFLLLLFMTSLTGLALLAWRETPAMANLLALHLGVVTGLFITLPYGKFVHAIYRSAALLRYSVEKQRPLPTLAPD